MNKMVLSVCMVLSCWLPGAGADELDRGFSNPPASAKPHTWWHWMNGNVTREGITADLEAMAQAGIGGAQVFVVDCGIPQGPIQFMSPEWRALFKHAVQEADRLGLEICAHNCAGWSSSGGPWNTPENAMKRISTSEVKIKGPARFSGILPQPETTLDFYRDIAVLAFPLPASEARSATHKPPKVTASVKGDAMLLRDGRVDTHLTFPAPGAGGLNAPFVLFEFDAPTPVRGIQMLIGPGRNEFGGVVQVSDDGHTFRAVKSFDSNRNTGPSLHLILDDTPVSARIWKIAINRASARTPRISLSEIDFTERLVIENLNAKTGRMSGGVIPFNFSTARPDELVKRSDVRDLTSKLTADGRLTWDAPAGEWVVVRVGQTLTGKNNHPAPKEGTGLECDKLSAEAYDAHWAGFMQKIVDDVGPLAGKTLNNALIDSYEVGGQNWTARFREEFRARRGYDLQPFFPVFTGRVVDSPEVTERFLWDMRRTIADLFAEKYFGRFAELCRKNNLLTSIEPYGNGPFEALQCGGPSDIVMGEFWSGSEGHFSVKLAASVAHIYGKTIVGAESFTAQPEPGRWLNDPASFKALGDAMYCQGLNRYIFHRYAMQPWTNRWPGMTMGQWGFHFERTVTWWNQAHAWLDYVKRCQFMLQQGRTVADVAYFCGEGAPVEMIVGDPAMPPGYDYDAVNADVLMKGATVQNGEWVLAGGARYRVLVLPPGEANMRPELLAKLHDGVAAGATLVGPRPRFSPSLQDYPGCDAAVRRLAAEMWGDCDGKTVTSHAFGKGRVVWGVSLEEVLKTQGVKPDFEFRGEEAKLLYHHRRTPKADIYFVSNQRHDFQTADVILRAEGKMPEVWNPQTGRMRPAAVWQAEDGRTRVRLNFEPQESLFIVFRSPAQDVNWTEIKRSGPDFPASVAPVAVLNIEKARYGVFQLKGNGWLDVTEKVNAMLTPQARTVRVGNRQAGEDPAPNTPKHLMVYVATNGQTNALTAREGAPLEIPAGMHVVRAFYGVDFPENPDGRHEVDVTGTLKQRIKNGRLTVAANNRLADGKDPAFGLPKELRVTYTFNGVRQNVVVLENSELTLPPQDMCQGPPPVFEAQSSAPGKLELLAWVPGTFTLSRSEGKSVTVRVDAVPAPMDIEGPWQVRFPAGWGAPESATFEKLISWPAHAHTGIKYFSGTAVYTKEFDAPASLVDARRVIRLDLGVVKNFAEVKLNGHALGVLWKSPFYVDVTAALKPGRNQLEIKVTNLWPNRLIGDEQLPPDREWNGKQLAAWPQWLLDGKPSPTGRFTFTTWHHWTQDDPLLDSGLLGPVRLWVAEKRSIP